MDSRQIIDAMEKQIPVFYDGAIYREIIEYILWYDNSCNQRRSVVLVDQNRNRVRVLASKISLAESERRNNNAENS